MSESFPLSAEQSRLWWLQRDGGPYRAVAELHLTGLVDRSDLDDALAVLVRRHEILRTRLRRVEWLKVPQQEVGEEGPVVAHHDLSDLPGEEGRRRWKEVTAARRGPEAEAFFTVARFADDDLRLQLDLPSWLADLPTLGLLAEDLATILADGSGEPPLQYVDFAVWQDELRESMEDEEEPWLAFWQSRLEAAECAPSLPGLAAAGDGPPRPEEVTLPLDTGVAAGLEGTAARLDVELEDLLLTATALWLRRFTDEPELALGYRFDGRKFEELADGTGPYARILPLRLRIDLNEPLRDLAQRSAAVRREADGWQEYGMPPEVGGRSCDEVRFPFVVEVSRRLGALDAGAARLRMIHAHVTAEPEAVNVSWLVGPSGVDGRLVFDGGRLAAEAAARHAGQIAAVCAQLVADEDRCVGSVEVLSGEERRIQEQTLDRRAEAREESSPSFLAAFRRQVEARPEAPALVGEEESWTYAELERASAAEARRLIRLGVGPEDRVAVYAGRTPSAVLAVLAVVRSGAAYVPLDPAFPAARSEGMMEDAGATWLLVSPEHSEEAPFATDRVLVLGEDGAAGGGTQEFPEPWPDHLAYVLFTSGSTGRPKGVAVEHRQLAAYTAAVLDLLAPEPGAAWGVVSTLAADLSNTMVFPGLASGGCLHLVDEERVADGAALASYLAERPLDYLKIVPSHLEALSSGGGLARLLPRRVLLLGGEAPAPVLLRSLAAAAEPGLEVWNHYGPTETTVGALAGRFTPAGDTAPALGAPLPGYAVRVLDGSLRSLPLEVTGELCIAGAGVSRGYLGRPGETAARFVPDPHGAPGGRLYRTGDRAVVTAAGQVRFAGRADRQVKLRGFRVELGEVEATLRGLEGISSAALVAHGEAATRRLVAYVVAAPGVEVAPRELRRLLAQRLPEVMVPATVVPLASLPLTPNGKLDRDALPDPDSAFGASGSTVPAALADRPVEEILHGVWCELLGHGSIARDRSFFDLGGHSLLATRVIARLRNLFGIDLPVGALFEAPTLAALSEVVEKAVRASAGDGMPPLTRRSGGDELPLSFAQRRLWVLEKLSPGLTAYNLPAAVELEGELDRAALQRTFDELVRRHEVLRTRYAEIGGAARQVVEEAAPVPLPRIELGHLDEETAEAEALRLAQADARRPFDLQAGPVLRLRLFQIRPRRHLLTFTLHHIAGDAWSRGVVVGEVRDLYAAFSAGRVSPLPALPIQYGDYAVWQRRWVQGEVLDAEIAYWKERLAGLPPRLELPTDRPRPAVQTFRGETLYFGLGEELSQRLRSLARQLQVTLFMILTAAFQLLLSRLSGQDDLAVGTPVAGRERQELEPLVGFFVNTLVLRADLSGDPDFAVLLKRVREDLLDALRHGSAPFERLVDELVPERSLAHAPLFQVAIALQNTPEERLEAAGLEIRPVTLRPGTSKFELNLFLAEDQDRKLAGGLTYNRDLFDAATAGRMVDGFTRLLEAAVEDADRPASLLPLLSEAERRQLLETWGRTPAPDVETSEETVVDLVIACAAASPTALAVADPDGALTYGELERASKALAAHLRHDGAGSGDVVAVELPSSAASVVAILAVVRTGAAYLPLDPALPEERKRFMVEDSGAGWWLHTAGGAPSAPAGVRTLTPEMAGTAGDGASTGPPPAPGDLAYLIYTSGSTGWPKAVEVEHRGLMNLARWHRRRYELSPEDRCSLVASPGFDASVWETWPALTAGASLHVPGAEARSDPQRLVDWLSGHGITVSFLPTPLAEAVLANPWAGAPALRYLLTGGDRLHRGSPAQATFTLVNHYGPTEATVVSTAAVVSPGAAPPPIGRPIDGTAAAVLDAHGHPVPVGVVGALWVSGRHLARGYRRRPGLTADRFRPHPHSRQPGERAYRTGDLVRWDADGDLHFHGRVDRQVKLRGFRIELGEVESVLAAHPRIAESVAVVRQDGGGGLVAYLVAEAGGGEDPPDLEEVGRWAARRLPDYMCPSSLVALDRLPLTPNGKVDRDALPAPQRAGVKAAEAGALPVGGREERLAVLWQEVLGVEEIGRDDDFFALGGDSILAIQVASRGREEGLEVTPRLLFENPTLAALAAAVEATPRVEAEQGPVTGPVLMTPLQHRLLERSHPAPHHFNQSVMLSVGGGGLEPPLLARALDLLLRHHDALRFRFLRRGDAWAQVATEVGGEVPLRVLDLPAMRPREHATAVSRAAAAAQASLHLAEGSLVRCLLIRSPGEDDRLLLVIHHLVVDAVSWRILLRDLERLYTGLVAGLDTALPAKTTSFQRWTELLAERATRPEVRSAAAAYWGGARWRRAVSPPADDGVDTEAGTGTYGAQERVSFEMGREDTRLLMHQLPERCGAHVEEVLLAALAIVWRRWTGGALQVDLEGHGREEEVVDGADLSRTVGWFTTTYPVFLEAADDDPAAMLAAVQEELATVPGGGLDYGLVRYLAPVSDGARELEVGPSEVSFNYLGQVDAALAPASRFRPAAEDKGPSQGRDVVRLYRLDVRAVVTAGRLRVTLQYDRTRQRAETLEARAEDLRETVLHLLHLGRSGQLEPAADLDLVDLDAAELDEALEGVEFEE